MCFDTSSMRTDGKVPGPCTSGRSAAISEPTGTAGVLVMPRGKSRQWEENTNSKYVTHPTIVTTYPPSEGGFEDTILDSALAVTLNAPLRRFQPCSRTWLPLQGAGGCSSGGEHVYRWNLIHSATRASGAAWMYQNE